MKPLFKPCVTFASWTLLSTQFALAGAAPSPAPLAGAGAIAIATSALVFGGWLLIPALLARLQRRDKDEG